MKSELKTMEAPVNQSRAMETETISKNGLLFVIACFALLVASTSVSAQSELTYQNGIFQNGAKLTPEQVRGVMSSNAEALQQYNSGRSLFVAGQVIAYPSAFLLGWDLGTRLGGGEGNGTLLAVGAVGTVVGLIMGFSGESQIKKSVQLYNTKTSYNAVPSQLNFGFTQTGIGFSMKF